MSARRPTQRRGFPANAWFLTGHIPSRYGRAKGPGGHKYKQVEIGPFRSKREAYSTAAQAGIHVWFLSR